MEQKYLIISNRDFDTYSWIGEVNSVNNDIVNYNFWLNGMENLTTHISNVKFITKEQYDRIYTSMVELNEDLGSNLLEEIING